MSPVVVLFDIDGTLEVGDPPGPISLDLVRQAIALGYVVGSASDRVLSFQRELWRRHEIDLHFIGHKHHLHEIRSRYPDLARYVHIGDTETDRYYADMHGFEFYWQDQLPSAGSPDWIF